jgi:Cdc6-like AAA superfamily ATPase
MGKRNRLHGEANVLPDNLELNDEFVGSFNLILRRNPLALARGMNGIVHFLLRRKPRALARGASLENTNDSIFITGKAGTGKTTLLKYFKKDRKIDSLCNSL